MRRAVCHAHGEAAPSGEFVAFIDTCGDTGRRVLRVVYALHAEGSNGKHKRCFKLIMDGQGSHDKPTMLKWFTASNYFASDNGDGKSHQNGSSTVVEKIEPEKYDILVVSNQRQSSDPEKRDCWYDETKAIVFPPVESYWLRRFDDNNRSSTTEIRATETCSMCSIHILPTPPSRTYGMCSALYQLLIVSSSKPVATNRKTSRKDTTNVVANEIIALAYKRRDGQSRLVLSIHQHQMPLPVEDSQSRELKLDCVSVSRSLIAFTVSHSTYSSVDDSSEKRMMNNEACVLGFVYMYDMKSKLSSLIARTQIGPTFKGDSKLHYFEKERLLAITYSSGIVEFINASKETPQSHMICGTRADPSATSKSKVRRREVFVLRNLAVDLHNCLCKNRLSHPLLGMDCNSNLVAAIISNEQERNRSAANIYFEMGHQEWNVVDDISVSCCSVQLGLEADLAQNFLSEESLVKDKDSSPVFIVSFAYFGSLYTLKGVASEEVNCSDCDSFACVGEFKKSVLKWESCPEMPRFNKSKTFDALNLDNRYMVRRSNFCRALQFKTSVICYSHIAESSMIMKLIEYSNGLLRSSSKAILKNMLTHLKSRLRHEKDFFRCYEYLLIMAIQRHTYVNKLDLQDLFEGIASGLDRSDEGYHIEYVRLFPHILRQFIVAIGSSLLTKDHEFELTTCMLKEIIKIIVIVMQNVSSKSALYSYALNELSGLLVSCRKLNKRLQKYARNCHTGLVGSKSKKPLQISASEGDQTSHTSLHKSEQSFNNEVLLSRNLEIDLYFSETLREGHDESAFTSSSIAAYSMKKSSNLSEVSLENLCFKVASTYLLKSLLSGDVREHQEKILRTLRGLLPPEIFLKSKKLIALSMKELEKGSACRCIRIATVQLRKYVEEGLDSIEDDSLADYNKISIIDDGQLSISYLEAQQNIENQLLCSNWRSPELLEGIGLDCGDIPIIVSGAWSEVIKDVTYLFGSGSFSSGSEDRKVACSPRTDERTYYLPISMHWIGAWDISTFIRVLIERNRFRETDLQFEKCLNVVDDEISSSLTSGVRHFNALMIYHAWTQDLPSILTRLLELDKQFCSQAGDLHIRLSELRFTENCSKLLADNIESGDKEMQSRRCAVIKAVNFLPQDPSHLCVSMMSKVLEEKLFSDGILTRLYWPSMFSFISMLARSNLLLPYSIVQFKSRDLFGLYFLLNRDSIKDEHSCSTIHSLIVAYCCVKKLPSFLHEHLLSYNSNLKGGIKHLLEAAGDEHWAHALIYASYNMRFKSEMAVAEFALSLDHSAVPPGTDPSSNQFRLCRLRKTTNLFCTLCLAEMHHGKDRRSWLIGEEVCQEKYSGTFHMDNFESEFLGDYPSLCTPMIHENRFREPKMSVVKKEQVKNLEYFDHDAFSSLSYRNFRLKAFETSEGGISVITLLPMERNPVLKKLLELAINGLKRVDESVHQNLVLQDTCADDCSHQSRLDPDEYELSLYQTIKESFHSPPLEVSLSLSPDHHLKRGKPMAAMASALNRNWRGFMQTDEESCRVLKTIPDSAIADLEADAVMIAMDYFDNESVIAACCAAIELCGKSAWSLRIKLSAIRRIACFAKVCNNECRNHDYSRCLSQYISYTKARNIFLGGDNNLEIVEMADALENITLSMIRYVREKESTSQSVVHARSKASALWWLVQAFCKCHGLALKRGFVRMLAEDSDWVGLLSQAYTDHLSISEIVEVVEKFCIHTPIRQHVCCALSSLKNCEGDTKGQLTEEIADLSKISDVRMGYDNDNQGTLVELFSVVAQAEAKDLSGLFLLQRAHELRWPILAIIASCFDDIDKIDCMREWLKCTISETENNHRMSEETLEKVIEKLCDEGVLLPLQRGLSIFFPESPIYFAVAGLRHSMNFRQADAMKFFQSCSRVLKATEDRLGDSDANQDSKYDAWMSKMTRSLIDSILSSSKTTSTNRLKILKAIQKSELFRGHASTVERYDKLLFAHNMLASKRILENMKRSPFSITDFIFGWEDKKLDVDVLKIQKLLCECGRWQDARSWTKFGGLSNDDITEAEVTAAINKCRNESWESSELRLILWEHIDALMLDNELPADRAGHLIMSHIQSLHFYLNAAERLFVLQRAKTWLMGDIKPITNDRKMSLLMQQLHSLVSETAMDDLLEKMSRTSENCSPDKTSEFLSYYQNSNEQSVVNLKMKEASFSDNILPQLCQSLVAQPQIQLSETKTPLRRLRKTSETVRNRNMDIIAGTPPRVYGNRESFTNRPTSRRSLFGDEDKNYSKDTNMERKHRISVAIQVLLEDGKVVEATKLSAELDSLPIELGLVQGARLIAEHCYKKHGTTSSSRNRDSLITTDIPPAALLPVHVIGYLQRHGELTNVASASAMEYLIAIENACGEGCGRSECARIRVTLEVSYSLGIKISEIEMMEERAVFRLLLIRGSRASRDLLGRWAISSRMTEESISRELVDCFMNGLLSTSGIKSLSNDDEGQSDRRFYNSVARSLQFGKGKTLAVSSTSGETHEDIIIEDEKYTINKNDDTSVWNAKDFLAVSDLCNDNVELGNALLSGAISREAPSSCQTELIILAYHFYSSASPPCFDGMETLMAFTHACAESFVSNKDFKCTMRLIAGIGKYRIMKKELILLAENGELEVLLKKRSVAEAVSGDGNIASLRLAVLDAIRAARPGDKDAEAMAYIHFDMYRSLANFLYDQASLKAMDVNLDEISIVDGSISSLNEIVHEGNTSSNSHAVNIDRNQYTTTVSRLDECIEEIGILLSAAEAFDQSGAPSAAARCGAQARKLLMSYQQIQ